MPQPSYGAALDALLARNEALLVLYREGAKNLLSRSISSLAASMIDQRRELAKDVASLKRQVADAGAPIDFELTASTLPPNPSGEGAKGLLESMKKIEAEDYEFLSSLAGAVLPLSVEAAERLASLAEQARKRSSWAQDHLELLGI